MQSRISKFQSLVTKQRVIPRLYLLDIHNAQRELDVHNLQNNRIPVASETSVIYLSPNPPSFFVLQTLDQFQACIVLCQRKFEKILSDSFIIVLGNLKENAQYDIIACRTMFINSTLPAKDNFSTSNPQLLFSICPLEG